MRDEYIEFVHAKAEPNQMKIKVEQVNLGAPLE
jgi:hypothetical protein